MTPQEHAAVLARRHPFEVFILIMSIISGIPLLLGTTKAGSVNDLLPEPLYRAWGLILVLGAVCALVGIAWRERVLGAILEQIGLAAVGGAAMLYGVAIVANVGFYRGGVSASVIFGFGAACWWRWGQIQHSIRALAGE